jgi:Flp pilus assembly protein TadG
MRLPRSTRRRRGVAAVEMAVLAPVLLLFLMGLWEVGRMVMIQQILDDTARETGRLAASGGYLCSNSLVNPQSTSTPPTPISLNLPSAMVNYEAQQKALLWLSGEGVSIANATVTINNVGSTMNSHNWTSTWTENGTANGGSGTTTGYDPGAAAYQLDQINVTVTLPYQNIAWSPLSWFLPQSTILTANSTWFSLNDIPVTVSTIIPSKPLQPTDPIP